MKLNTSITAIVVSAIATKNSFGLFVKDEKEPIFVSRKIAAEDGYVHKSQFIGQSVTFNPTQETNGAQGKGWLGQLDLPLANISNNALLQHRQTTASNYAMASLYREAAVAES